MRRDGTENSALSPDVGSVTGATRFTVNIAEDVGAELRNLAFAHRVSESSIVEIALRQLFKSVQPDALGSFLRDHGACLRRRT